jgi:hypothetical protein
MNYLKSPSNKKTNDIINKYRPKSNFTLDSLNTHITPKRHKYTKSVSFNY